MSRSTAEVDLAAVRSNVARLAALVAPSKLCVVVKADGYGHGAVPVAQAALAAGATWLGVAQLDEADALRAAGIDAPVLLLAEPDPGEVADAVRLGVRVALYRAATAAALSAAARASGRSVRVHLKVDTGMHRVGAHPDEVVGLARLVAESAGLELEALWTHFAVADEPAHPFTATQLRRLHVALDELERAGLRPPMVHAANSAAAISVPGSRLDLVRCGIVAYGIAPSPGLEGLVELTPALRWSTTVAHTRVVPAGEGVSYGLRHRLAADTVIATVPVGYADGVRRDLGLAGQDVLVGGRRCPLVGVVTMDQALVDLGPGAATPVGEEVVLLGSQGREAITPQEWAQRLGTIAYEVVCAIGARVERRYRDGAS